MTSKVTTGNGVPTAVAADVLEILATRLEEVKATDGYARLTEEGEKYLQGVFTSNPERFVGTNSLLSVTSLYPSRKLGLQIQAESDSAERLFVIMPELDDEVMFIVDQPPPIHIRAHDRTGRMSPRGVTRDYIRFRKHGIDLIECKREQDLNKLGATYPKDWIKDVDGTWKHLPSNEAAARLGMGHEVFVPDSLEVATTHNFDVLLSLRDFAWSASSAPLARRVSSWLAENGARSVLEICKKYGKVTGGLIVSAAMKGILHVNLSRQLIDNDMLVFPNREALDKYINGCDEKTAVTINERWARSSTSERNGAVKAKELYDRRRAEGKPKNSTDYRYDARIKSAKKQGFEEIFAFMPNHKGRGNRKARLDPNLVESIRNEVKTYYRERSGKHTASGFYAFLAAQESYKDRLPSLTTIRRIFIESLAPEAAAFMEGGKRAFHATRPLTDGALANLRPRIPGFLTHLDGVFGDRYSKESEDKLFLRPIYYPLIDDHTGYVYARGVKVGNASSVPVLMAIRDCVRRHGGLPRRIMRDWGSELQSDAFRYLGGIGNIELASRPKSAPRFGARGESFNQAFSRFLQSNAGGSYFDKCGRSADGSKKGRATALDSFDNLIRQGDEWIFDVWNKSPIDDEELSPEQMNQELMAAFPESLIKMDFDDLFLYATSYPIASRKIDYTRGLRFGTTRFSSVELTSLLRAGWMPSSPRLDCENPSVIWLDGPEGVFQARSLDYKRDIIKDAAARIGGLRRILNSRRQSETNQSNRRALEERKRIEIALAGAGGVSKGNTVASSSKAPPRKNRRKGAATKSVGPKKRSRAATQKTIFPRLDDPA